MMRFIYKASQEDRSVFKGRYTFYEKCLKILKCENVLVYVYLGFL